MGSHTGFQSDLHHEQASEKGDSGNKTWLGVLDSSVCSISWEAEQELTHMLQVPQGQSFFVRAVPFRTRLLLLQRLCVYVLQKTGSLLGATLGRGCENPDLSVRSSRGPDKKTAPDVEVILKTRVLSLGICHAPGRQYPIGQDQRTLLMSGAELIACTVKSRHPLRMMS